MSVTVILLGLLQIVAGVFLIAQPKKYQTLMLNQLAAKNFKWWGTLAAVIGFMLCLAAPVTQYPWFITLLGCSACIKAGYTFFAPAERISNNFFFKLDEPKVRIWGVVAVLFGLFMLGIAG